MRTKELVDGLYAVARALERMADEMGKKPDIQIGGADGVVKVKWIDPPIDKNRPGHVVDCGCHETQGEKGTAIYQFCKKQTWHDCHPYRDVYCTQLFVAAVPHSTKPIAEGDTTVTWHEPPDKGAAGPPKDVTAKKADPERY